MGSLSEDDVHFDRYIYGDSVFLGGRYFLDQRELRKQVSKQASRVRIYFIVLNEAF